jgi:hypothetical protein
MSRTYRNTPDPDRVQHREPTHLQAQRTPHDSIEQEVQP